MLRPVWSELPEKGSHAGVRVAIVALKRGNARGAKGGRKADW